MPVMTRKRIGERLIAALLAWLSHTSTVHAATVEVGPGADVRSAIGQLEPGDELVLRGGTYSFSSAFVITAVGKESQPITIRGKNGETALIEMTTDAHNVVEIQGSRYLVLRDLHIRGGSHGIRLLDSDFVTIENNEVYETGDVGISANAGGTYEGLVIRGNHIHHTNGFGEGIYLGCNNDACRVLNSVIELNHIHHTNGPTVEQGDGIELKEGSAGNTIRHNVIHDTNYPGILTYSAAGNGPPNVIEGNVIWNSNDFAIQSAADAILRNNIVLGTIGLQAHQSGSPSNQTITHNTIVSNGNGIEVRGVSGLVVIANNAIYARGGAAISLISGSTSLVIVAGNVGSGGVSGASTGYTEGRGIDADFVAGNFSGAPPIDLFPKIGSALIGAGAAEFAAVADFNGTPRAGATDAGAYSFEPGGNPGWTLAPAFKVLRAAASTQPPPTNLRGR
jgi:hypothetical protein